MTLFMDQDLCQRPASALRQELRKGSLSASSLLEATIDRIERLDGELGAFLTLDLERARHSVAHQDAMAAKGLLAGPLHGLPLAVKDIFETADLRTTYGSRAFADHVPTRDCLHVARLRAAGAVIIGKTNTPEFAFGGQTVNLLAPVTRNPLNPSRSVAGSSGGAAAALATGMTALADASDLGGSARTPAAWCGLVGFRPSAGRVPMAVEHPAFPNHHGPCPMGRSLADVALMFQVMAGLPVTDLGQRELPKGLRVAWDMAPGGAAVEPSLLAAVAPARRLLETLGCEIHETPLPTSGLLRLQHFARNLAAVAVEAQIKPDLTLCGQSFTTALEAGRRASHEEISDAQIQLAAAIERNSAFFAEHDLLIWPTAAGLAFSADLSNEAITEDWRPVELTPLLGLPAITLPCGRGADGLPAGLQIIGARGKDSLVLRTALALEAALNF